MMIIEKKIKELREQAGLSQFALAQLAGVRSTTINRLEAGKFKPKYETIEAIITALKCELVIKKSNGKD